MRVETSKTRRKILGLILAIILYYIIHEGAHLIYALYTNCFEKVVILFPGVQIKVNLEMLSNNQIGLFSILGAIASLSTAYILCLLRNQIALFKSNSVRAIFYYITILFLLNDPIYLSLLYNLFGGGDMNGIALIIPKSLATIIFLIIVFINLIIIFKFIVPTYKKAYKFYNNK